jgi:DNA methylase
LLSVRETLLVGRLDVPEALRSIDWSFDRDGVRDLTHNLHPWPAKFIPQIPAAVIATCSERGDRVLDPFAGCGTTAVEALRAGRSVLATDVNPLAVLITKAKSRPPNAVERERIVAWSDELSPVRVSRALLDAAPAIPNIEYWFDPQVVAQLSFLRQAIAELDIAPAFLQVVFSSIINAVSHQESETRYRRIERDVGASETLDRFRKRLARALVMAAEFEAAVSGHELAAQIACCDARELTNLAEEASCDLAVFSPPYPNAFDYHLYHRFRLFWLGHDPRQLKHSEIGAHLRYQTEEDWREDMRESLVEVAALLRPEAICVVVVGSGIIAGQPVHSGNILWDLAAAAGLTPAWRTTRMLSAHRRAFNLSDGRLLGEDVLVFRR